MLKLSFSIKCNQKYTKAMYSLNLKKNGQKYAYSRITFRK